MASDAFILIFLSTHIAASVIFLGFCSFCGKFTWFTNEYIWRVFAIVAFIIASIGYIGISYRLSGSIIRIGDLKTNLCSVLLISILLFFVWLFCLIGDDGSFFHS